MKRKNIKEKGKKERQKVKTFCLKTWTTIHINNNGLHQTMAQPVERIINLITDYLMKSSSRYLGNVHISSSTISSSLSMW